ncbi:MAG: hypothetical protein RMJ84_05435 [Sandaracinaceae bacterium]|nr:hypothetical protein [Sandaracinaceae bacterium]
MPAWLLSVGQLLIAAQVQSAIAESIALRVAAYQTAGQRATVRIRPHIAQKMVFAGPPGNEGLSARETATVLQVGCVAKASAAHRARATKTAREPTSNFRIAAPWEASDFASLLQKRCLHSAALPATVVMGATASTASAERVEHTLVLGLLLKGTRRADALYQTP